MDTEAFGPSMSCGLGFNETSEMLEEEQRGRTRSMSRLRDQPKVSVRSWTRTFGGRLRDFLFTAVTSCSYQLVEVVVGGVTEFQGGLK